MNENASSAAAPPAPASPPKPHRGRARALLIVASAVLVVAVLATWVRAQLIDTDGWTETSVRLLQNDEIRGLVASSISDRLLRQVDVEDLAAERLPSDLSRLAPALSTAIAEVLPRAVDRALTLPAVQTLWAETNRRAHKDVILLLDGGSGALSTKGGVVALNVEHVLNQIGSRLGIGANIGEKVPPQRREIVLLRSNQLKLAQDVVEGLRGLSFVLPLIAVLLYLGALWVGEGARRQVLMEVGIAIIGVALISLVLRRWVESYVVDELVRQEGNRPAARELLAIVTSGWRDRALWLLVTGALAVAAAWLAGPMRWALAVRRVLAGPLERHPALSVAVVVAAVLLIASLGPARTPGQAIPLLIVAALAVVGVLALRRQVIQERVEAAAPG